MAEEPKVGDRVRVMYEGVVKEIDFGDDVLVFAVEADGRFAPDVWVRPEDVTVLPDLERFKQYLRDAVGSGHEPSESEALGLKVWLEEQNRQGRYPTLVQVADWAMLPHEREAPHPQPERSPTAIEERLQAVERAAGVSDELYRKVQLLEQHGVGDATFRVLVQRVTELERKMKALRAGLRMAANLEE